jgi:hypothetical protein
MERKGMDQELFTHEFQSLAPHLTSAVLDRNLLHVHLYFLGQYIRHIYLVVCWIPFDPDRETDAGGAASVYAI